MRINQYLASCGISSRRKAESFILSGKVSVNGNIITDLFFQIDEKKDDVRVDGVPVKASKRLYYILNKPIGIVSAVSSPFDEKTVVELIDSEGERIFPVGRLDKDSEGLLFLTNDGDFAYKLTHPSFEQEKVYEAIVSGKIDSSDLWSMRKGISIGPGEMAMPAQVRLVSKQGEKIAKYSIAIKEGKYRQIRRMFEACGAKVVSLRRTSEGGISLGKLKPGQYRELTNKEIAYLMADGNERKLLEKTLYNHPGATEKNIKDSEERKATKFKRSEDRKNKSYRKKTFEPKNQNTHDRNQEGGEQPSKYGKRQQYGSNNRFGSNSNRYSNGNEGNKYSRRGSNEIGSNGSNNESGQNSKFGKPQEGKANGYRSSAAGNSNRFGSTRQSSRNSNQSRSNYGNSANRARASENRSNGNEWRRNPAADNRSESNQHYAGAKKTDAPKYQRPQGSNANSKPSRYGSSPQYGSQNRPSRDQGRDRDSYGNNRYSGSRADGDTRSGERRQGSYRDDWKDRGQNRSNAERPDSSKYQRPQSSDANSKPSRYGSSPQYGSQNRPSRDQGRGRDSYGNNRYSGSRADGDTRSGERRQGSYREERKDDRGQNRFKSDKPDSSKYQRPQSSDSSSKPSRYPSSPQYGSQNRPSRDQSRSYGNNRYSGSRTDGDIRGGEGRRNSYGEDWKDKGQNRSRSEKPASSNYQRPQGSDAKSKPARYASSPQYGSSKQFGRNSNRNSNRNRSNKGKNGPNRAR